MDGSLGGPGFGHLVADTVVCLPVLGGVVFAVLVVTAVPGPTSFSRFERFSGRRGEQPREEGGIDGLF